MYYEKIDTIKWDQNKVFKENKWRIFYILFFCETLSIRYKINILVKCIKIYDKKNGQSFISYYLYVYISKFFEKRVYIII